MSTIQIELPESIHQRAKQLAERQSMSLDRLVVVALAEKLGTASLDANLEARAQRGQRAGFEKFMSGVPDVEPETFDKLPEISPKGK